MEITLQCPKCKSSVNIKFNKKTEEGKIQWTIPIDTDKIQELLVNQIREMTLHLRGGEIIRVKCHSK